MADIQKAMITLGGVPLAATQAVVWKFISGVVPYIATFAVHKTAWDRRLKGHRGSPLSLVITNSYGKTVTIQKLYILHEAPSDSPHRVNFVVADKRWKWQYQLIVRDFNMPRKTGNRTALFDSVPVETRVVIDKYDYLPYSLFNGERLWTPQDALRSVMDELESSSSGGSWRIESFPLKEKGQVEGGFTLQGITLRDSGNIAVSRLLSYIPGADIYINAEGKAIIYDATDLDMVDRYFKSLPVSTYTGEAAILVDRIKIRPKEVIVHYQREVEVVLDYRDDYGGSTFASPNRDAPYIENVIPTVDPQTKITEYDTGTGKNITKTVPPGTWVRVDNWLTAMDLTRTADSLPWSFATIKRHWLKGNLEGVLGARGQDLDKTANIAMRVQALRQHFRQTFRINRRYMERIRDILAVRVALLDPVTGARAPAAVWGQACIIPTYKGYMTGRLGDPTKVKVYLNVDYLDPSKAAGVKLIETSPGPTRVNLIDRELGIFRLDWIVSPYGTFESFIPCLLVDEKSNTPEVITRDLADQDTKPVGPGMNIESGTNGIFLRDFLEYKVMFTIIPAAPNNIRQFHRETVEADDVKELFRKEFRIQNGEGPALEVFVPPGEATARFAWQDDDQAYATVQNLLGLNEDDPTKAGIEGTQLPGYVLINDERHLTSHAISLAAELLAAFADSVQGAVVTRVPDGELKLVGNMTATTIRVGQAPSAKVDTVHQFPGTPRRISRLALMSDPVRAIVLGTILFKE